MQYNTTNNGSYSLVVTVIGLRYHFFTASDRVSGGFLVPVILAVKSNLTAWYNQILSNHALNALT